MYNNIYYSIMVLNLFIYIYIMNTIENYDFLLNKIFYNIERYSGTHSINIDKAEQWIISQPTKESKLAAKKIIDVTEYITYKDVLLYIEKLVKQEYKKIANTNKKIYMFVSNINDSNHFISILALYFIRKYGYREPDKYFEFLPDNIEDNSILLYFDDMAYSGGQIIANITNIYKDIIIKQIVAYMYEKFNLNIVLSDNSIINKFVYIATILTKFYKTKTDKEINKIKIDLYKYIIKSKYCNIIYLLLGINKTSYDRIINISLINLINKYFSKIIDNIDKDNIKLFKLNYKIKYVKMYPILEDLCTEKEIFFMTYFFSFGRTPVVSIYYDHKIGNMSSTFLRVLNFGPIVPINFDISHYWKPFKYITTDEGYELATTIKIVSISKNYLYFIYLCNKYYKIIENNNTQDINKIIKYIPFINNCYNIENVINNYLMKKLDYLIFISDLPKLLYFSPPSNNILTNKLTIIKDCKTPFISVTDLLYYKYPVNKELRTKIYYFIKNIMVIETCNISFYKNKDYLNYTDISKSKKSFKK